MIYCFYPFLLISHSPYKPVCSVGKDGESEHWWFYFIEAVLDFIQDKKHGVVYFHLTESSLKLLMKSLHYTILALIALPKSNFGDQFCIDQVRLHPWQSHMIDSSLVYSFRWGCRCFGIRQTLLWIIPGEMYISRVWALFLNTHVHTPQKREKWYGVTDHFESHPEYNFYRLHSRKWPY